MHAISVLYKYYSYNTLLFVQFNNSDSFKSSYINIIHYHVHSIAHDSVHVPGL